MATFMLIHGAGDAGWYWHLTETELRARGHHTIAPDLPCDNHTASLDDYAGTVIGAAADRKDLVIVSQSYGAFTATLAASRLPARLLVQLAGMIPAPGESPGQWCDSTGYREAAEQQARLDGGKTGHDDPLICYYNGVPRPLAEEALRRGGRGESAVVWDTPLATRCVAGRAHQVHPGQRRPVLPRRLHAAGGIRTPGHHPGRGSRLSLRRAQPPEGTQRPSHELPRLTGDRMSAASAGGDEGEVR
jgi:pimeloyl-ACP methyl ester carboxylesterase